MTDFNGFQNFQIDCDDHGIMTAVLDVPDRPFNVFDEHVLAELNHLLDLIEQDGSVKLVVFRSGKESGFLAGADVRRIQSIQSREEAEAVLSAGQDLFNRLENLSVPTLAVIHGPCLGGGLEFALACSFRVARDDSSTRLGLPEIELGLLPGWGGTKRLPALIGLTPALGMILEGKKLSAQKALRVGLVDRAPTAVEFEQVLAKFITRILNGTAKHASHASFLDTLRDRTSLGQWLVFKTVRNRIRHQKKHYPALGYALDAIEHGLRSRAKGLAAERAGFAELVLGSTSRNLIGLFFLRERARRHGTWTNIPREEVHPVERIAVIGAGTMGAGIAQLAAHNGLEVVLKDINAEYVEAGMQKIRGLFKDLVKRGSLNQHEANARMARIFPTTEWDELRDVDLAIEAVTERMDIKRDVFRELDRHLPLDSIIVSNTSALSIRLLAAEATHRPGRVAGLHFFSPVHRMQLVEIVHAAGTSDQTIARLTELVRKLGKTPLVVADSPGFLVNRILFPYLDEAVRMTCEGVSVETIDREMKRFGMPMGPLELLDSVGVDVAADVAKTLSRLGADSSPTPERLNEMVARGWMGKKSQRGFYHYQDGKRGKPTVWGRNGSTSTPSEYLSTEMPADTGGEKFSAIQQRLVCLLINEAARCLEEGVVQEPWMVDLGMVLGTGFAPFRGGPLQLADEWGVRVTCIILEYLRRRHGERFAPTSKLRDMPVQGQTFYAHKSSQEDQSLSTVTG